MRVHERRRSGFPGAEAVKGVVVSVVWARWVEERGGGGGHSDNF